MTAIGLEDLEGVETIRFQYARGEYARALCRDRVRYFRLARDLLVCTLLAVIAYLKRNQGWPPWIAAGVAELYPFIVALSVGVRIGLGASATLASD